LKLCQFTAARWLDWLIAVLVAVWLIAAAPATTLPPVGRAFGAGCASAGSDRTSITVACSAVVIISTGRPRRTTPNSFISFSNRDRAIATPVATDTVSISVACSSEPRQHPPIERAAVQG
jgi:hypothetical protein